MSDETTDHVSGFAVPGDNTGPDKGSERERLAKLIAKWHGFCAPIIDHRDLAMRILESGFGDVAALRAERDAYRSRLLRDGEDHAKAMGGLADMFAALRAERDALAAKLKTAIACLDTEEQTMRRVDAAEAQRDAALAESKRMREALTEIRNDAAERGGCKLTERIARILATANAALAASAAAPAPAPAEGARLRPCGCVVCVCRDPERCHGCGAKMCAACRLARAAPAEATAGLVVTEWEQLASDCGMAVDAETRDEFVHRVRQIVEQAATAPPLPLTADDIDGSPDQPFPRRAATAEGAVGDDVFQAARALIDTIEKGENGTGRRYPDDVKRLAIALAAQRTRPIPHPPAAQQQQEGGT